MIFENYPFKRVISKICYNQHIIIDLPTNFLLTMSYYILAQTYGKSIMEKQTLFNKNYFNFFIEKYNEVKNDLTKENLSPIANAYGKLYIQNEKLETFN